MQGNNQITTKTLSRFVRVLLLGTMLCALGGLAGAGEFNSSRGFFIDLPEGFVFAEGDGSSRFSFSLGTMTVDLLVSDPGRYASAKAAAEDTAKRLGSRMTPTSFSYAGLDAAVAEFSFGSGQTARKGMAFFLNGQANKAVGQSSGRSSGQSSAQSAASPDKAYDLILLAHTSAADWQRDRELLLSCIDGYSATAADRSAPGPLGALARSRLKPSDRQIKTLQFEDRDLPVHWNPKEAVLAQELVEREYRVLVRTTTTQAAVEPGMQRFYRMVWRDSLPSLDQLALALSQAWETGSAIREARSNIKGNSAGSPADNSARDGARDSTQDEARTGPRFGPPANPRNYAQAILKWTQGFNYERDPKGSDVVNPLSAAFEQRGDCDSRILVLNILLRRENIESILMISLKHEHALLAVDAPGIGARYSYRGKQWLVGETTAPVDIGRIDARQANPADWFALEFPF